MSFLCWIQIVKEVDIFFRVIDGCRQQHEMNLLVSSFLCINSFFYRHQCSRGPVLWPSGITAQGLFTRILHDIILFASYFQSYQCRAIRKDVIDRMIMFWDRALNTSSKHYSEKWTCTRILHLDITQADKVMIFRTT